MLKVLDEFGLLKLNIYFFQMVMDIYGSIWIEQCVHNSGAFLSALV